MKNLLKFLQSVQYLFHKPHNTGVIYDSRSIEEKEKDYLYSDTVSQSLPFYGNRKIAINPYFREDQQQTSSCVAHGTTFSLQNAWKIINTEWTRLSKMFVYRQRSCYPSPGMWQQDAYDIERKLGSCLYNTLPTPSNEVSANAIQITQSQVDEAGKYKGLEYYRIDPANDIDAICAIAEQGYAVSIVFYSTYREWSREYPLLLDNPSYLTAPVRHDVCVLPNSGFMENGKKYLTIVDSSWFGGYNLRHLSEDFIAARVVDSMYWKTVVFKQSATDKPQHTFRVPLSKGMESTDIMWLQKVLVYEGLLPVDCVIGIFGPRTFAAVKALQTKYSDQILKPVGLTIPTGYVGSSTLAWLNKEYAAS
jgi:hypothetical protein